MRKIIVLTAVAFLAGCSYVIPNREYNRYFDTAKTIEAVLAPVDEVNTASPLGTTNTDDLDKDISLEKTVAVALTNNPELREAIKRVDAALARYRQAVSLDDTKAKYEAWAVPLSAGVNLNKAQMNMFGLSQELPFPGKLSLRGEVALKEVEMALSLYSAKEREIAEMTKKAYYEYFIANKELEINNENFQLQQENIKIVDIKYKVGTAPQQDSIKAQVEASLIYKDIIASEQRIASSVSRLNALLNRPSEKGFATPKEPEYKKLELALSETEATALENRPELKAAEANVKRSEAANTLAKADRALPDFDLAATYMQDPSPGANDAWGGMLAINLPWLNPKRGAQVAEKEAELSADKAQLVNMQNMTRYAIRDAVYKLQAAQQTAELYKTSILPEAEANVKSARTSYEKDKVDFLTLNEARIKLRDIKLAYYRALADVEISKAEVERIIGKDILEGGK